ncbi:protein FAR1-RELATED SEQUENCE 9-like isoform X1 [Aegilops tauschii subsp. strangulata]
MFGDVICFDTTYRKLDDGRPFGLIVGVNNHKKTMVFGATLLYDETAESFGWLFRTFLTAMSGKHPRTILTDEDAAMAKATSKVLPQSHHRLCVWHMNQNACKHLAGVVEEYKKFNADFQHYIYDIEEEDDFINEWNRMLDRYGLRDNMWLQRLFEKREQWALVYGKNTFSAHMSTTQRSESMNNELKRYISIKYDMLTFFEHFGRLVADKRFVEVKCDFKASQTTPKLKAEGSYVLRQAATTYTPAIFKMFQEQVIRTLNYDTFLCDSSDKEKKVYTVKFHGTQREHVVSFYPNEEKVNCSCKKFEFAGILCSHCLKILDINNIKHIPEHYILKRWTIDAKVLEITSNRNLHEDLKARMSNFYKDLCRMFIHIAASAAESDETYDMAAKCAEQLARDVEQSLKIRVDPDPNPDLGDSSVSQGPNIDSTRVSKHNEGLHMPRGIKVKEKTVRGSVRPVGGLEKAKTTKKKKIDDSLRLQPEMPFTNQMPTYNPILMGQFRENIVPGSARPIGGLEKAKTKKKKKTVNSLQERPEMPLTNQMPGYLPQYNPTQMVQLGALPSHAYPYLAHYNSSLQQSIGLSTPTMMPGQNILFFQQQTPTSGTSTPMIMAGQNLPFFQQQNPTIGTCSPTMMPGQNLSFFQ